MMTLLTPLVDEVLKTHHCTTQPIAIGNERLNLEADVAASLTRKSHSGAHYGSCFVRREQAQGTNIQSRVSAWMPSYHPNHMHTGKYASCSFCLLIGSSDYCNVSVVKKTQADYS